MVFHAEGGGAAREPGRLAKGAPEGGAPPRPPAAAPTARALRRRNGAGRHGWRPRAHKPVRRQARQPDGRYAPSRRGRLHTLGVVHHRSGLYGAVVRARVGLAGLNGAQRRFSARAEAKIDWAIPSTQNRHARDGYGHLPYRPKMEWAQTLRHRHSSDPQFLPVQLPGFGATTPTGTRRGLVGGERGLGGVTRTPCVSSRAPPHRWHGVS